MMPAFTFAQEEDVEEPDELVCEDGQLLVIYDGDSDYEETIDEVAEDVGVQVSDTEVVSELTEDGSELVQVELKNDDDIDEMIDELEAAPDVQMVQRNYVYELMDNDMELMAGLPNDEHASELYHLGAWDSTFSNDCGSNVLNAWDSVKTESAVSIAVLDSGVYAEHPDLKDNIDLKHAVDITTEEDTPGKITDKTSNGHGTHVAGVAAAVTDNSVGISGTSYNASIIPICVVTDEGTTNSGYLVEAYRYLDNLIENGELTNLHVINMSLGGYSVGQNDELLKKAITEMRDKHNVITVCAGGNGTGPTIDAPVFPGDYEKCICVTALDKKGNNQSDSDYNLSKDISAPGASILSTNSSSSKPYSALSGTSFAAPIVSGVMAMLWTANPQLTVEQAFDAVIRTANPVNTQTNDRADLTGSAGAIDAAEAVRYVEKMAAGEGKYIGSETVSIGTTAYVYDGTAKTPEVTIEGLEEGKDYEVTYQNNTEIGNATVTVTGKGDYVGKVIESFRIKAKDEPKVQSPLESMKLSTTTYTYNGKAKKPSVTVKAVVDGKTKTIASKVTSDTADIDITYPKGRTKVGTYVVSVKGIGAYKGTVTQKFVINPKPTKLKSVKGISRGFIAKWEKRSTQFTGYQVRYSTSKNFAKSKTSTKTFKKKKTVSYKKTKLKKNKTYYVKVRTFKYVSGKRYYSTWSEVKKVTTK